MKKFGYLVPVLLALSFQSAFGVQGNEAWMSIEHPQADMIRFEFCTTPDPGSCEQIGSRDYSTSELLALRKKLMRKTEIEVGAGVVLVGATALTGGFVGYVCGAWTFGASVAGYTATGALAGAAVGTGVDAGVSKAAVKTKIANLSPIANYEAARTLDPETLLNSEVKYNGNILDFRKNLEDALSELN